MERKTIRITGNSSGIIAVASVTPDRMLSVIRAVKVWSDKSKIRKNADQNKKHNGTVAWFTQEKINRCGNQQKQKHGFTDRTKRFEDETLFLLRRQLVLAILFLQFRASPTNLIGSSPAQFVLWIYMQCKEILQIVYGECFVKVLFQSKRKFQRDE